MTSELSLYLPQDRRRALILGAGLPEQAEGAALFADISGFTPLAEALACELGPRRGAEELTQGLNHVYNRLIAVVEAHGGSVIGFAGDALLSWFDAADGDAGLRAASCGLRLQRAMRAIAHLRTPGGRSFSLALSVGVAGGRARRLVVGDPQLQLFDVLAGHTLDRVYAAEALAGAGEVVVDEFVVPALGAAAVAASRPGPEAGRPFAVIAEGPWCVPVGATATARPPEALDPAQLQPWFAPAVFSLLSAGGAPPLPELRQAAALMLRFSGLDFDHDPAAGASLSRFIAHVQAVLASYGGTLLDLTMGQATSYLYAAFGAPAAHDDDAVRAVAASVALATPPPATGVDEVRIGLALGQLRVGPIGGAGRRTYAVLGDAANLAFRLMHAAPPGEIRCDGELARHARARWGFVPLAPLRLKGKATPSAVFRPGPPREQVRQPEASDRQLIGRASEIGQIEAVLATVASGAPRVLVIEGEAGIGKSHLAAELLRRAQSRGLATLTGAAQSLAAQTPYYAWREVVTALLGLERSDSGDPGAHLRATLAPTLAERIGLLNDVLPLGLPESEAARALDPRARSKSLGHLLSELLRARTAAGPLALLIEDAHWLDSGSWQLTLEAARSANACGHSLLLVLTTRALSGDQALAQLHALVALPVACHLRLGAVGATAIAALAADRLGVASGALPAELPQLLYERSRGNPLFADELLAALQEAGLVAVGPSGGNGPPCVVCGDLGLARKILPDTLQGLLLARIDRLPPEARLTLKVASVVGEVFPYRPLSHTLSLQADLDLTTVRNQLHLLAAQELTALEEPHPEPTYRFRHVLVQEAAYETLLFAQRRSMHRAVAEWHELTYGGESTTLAPHYPLLAHHYGRAEDSERERHYAHLAGVGAADRYANAEARAFFSRALELTPETDDAGRLGLLMARERIAELTAAREEQRRDIEAMEALAARLSEQQQAQIALRRGQYLAATGKFSEAAAIGQQIIALAQAAGDQVIAANGYSLWGLMLLRQSQPGEAAARLQHALELALAADDMECQLSALARLASIELERSNYQAALALDERRLAICRQRCDLLGESKALNDLGTTLQALGQYEQAAEHYRQAVAQAGRIGARLIEDKALGNLAGAQYMLGELGASWRLRHEVLRRHLESGERWSECNTRYSLGVIALDLGVYEVAQEHLEQAIALWLESGERNSAAKAQSELGRLHNSLGSPERGLEESRSALATLVEVGNRFEHARTLAIVGDALLMLGHPAEAQSAYAESLALWTELGQHRLLGIPLTGLVAAAQAQGDQAQALAYAEQLIGLMQDESLTSKRRNFRLYLVCYKALSAAGDPRAMSLLAQGHSALQRIASQLDDAHMRSCFLERIPHNRELRALWAALEHGAP